jgi:hypothetical protein
LKEEKRVVFLTGEEWSVRNRGERGTTRDAPFKCSDFPWYIILKEVPK